jgi:hypothetical protein
MGMRDRFNSKIKANPDTKCWEWCGTLANTGYGYFRLNGKNKYAHRVAYELYVGMIPSGLFVCHKCDNKRCVNPSHLFLGTPKENTHDSIKKGRWPTGKQSGSYTKPEKRRRGESHGQAKLSSSIVLEIRALYNDGGLSQRTLAAKYDLSQSQIGRILRRESWAHI